jgi:hypothetical protein
MHPHPHPKPISLRTILISTIHLGPKLYKKNQIVDVYYVNMSIILKAHKKWKLKVKQCMHDHTFSRFMYYNNIKNMLVKCWHLIIMSNFMMIQKNSDLTTHILWIFSKIKCTNKTHALNTVTLSSSIWVPSLPLTFEETKMATAFLINCHHETHLVWFWCIYSSNVNRQDKERNSSAT